MVSIVAGDGGAGVVCATAADVNATSTAQMSRLVFTAGSCC
jgi:hypothetical protein